MYKIEVQLENKSIDELVLKDLEVQLESAIEYETAELQDALIKVINFYKRSPYTYCNRRD